MARFTSNGDKSPEVDMSKWGDRIIGGDTPMQHGVDTSQLAATNDPGDVPLGIIVEPDIIVTMSVTRAKVREFNQMLLERFRDAGVPVDGSSGFLKLNRGKIFKLRSPPGQMEFRYVWLPDAYCRALAVDAENRQSLVQ